MLTESEIWKYYNEGLNSIRNHLFYKEIEKYIDNKIKEESKKGISKYEINVTIYALIYTEGTVLALTIDDSWVKNENGEQIVVEWSENEFDFFDRVVKQLTKDIPIKSACYNNYKDTMAKGYLIRISLFGEEV